MLRIGRCRNHNAEEMAANRAAVEAHMKALRDATMAVWPAHRDDPVAERGNNVAAAVRERMREGKGDA